MKRARISRRALRPRAAGFAWTMLAVVLAAVALMSCAPFEAVDPPKAPKARWTRPLQASDFGPYALNHNQTRGALFGSGDSLIWLQASDGSTMGSWAWPPSMKDLPWGQESCASSAFGLALFGGNAWCLIRPNMPIKLHPYPAGGASFRGGHLDDHGRVLLNWRTNGDSSSGQSGAGVNQVIQWHDGSWSVLAEAPNSQGLFDPPQTWKRGWIAVLRTGSRCELWGSDGGQPFRIPLVGGDGTGHPPRILGTKLVFASQDSAVCIDLDLHTRTWAVPLPEGFDFGVHGIAPDLGRWDLLSSRGWWQQRNVQDGILTNQGRISALWLDRWSGFPWSFSRGTELWYWGLENPKEAHLAKEPLGSLTVTHPGVILVREGSHAAAYDLP